MDRLTARLAPAPERPVRVMQFGEGNFLRAFVDYMIDIANEKGVFDGSVAIVKPIAFGNLDRFTQQDCRYTVLLRGLKDGRPYEETRVVTAVSRAIDPFSDYGAYAALARLDTLRFVVSNTTEAGIALDETDEFDLCPPKSYPGKLCKFLFERAEAFDYAADKGLIMLPVELIDDNGIMLEKCVKALAKKWNLGERFESWLDEACVFTSTLVDRIVTGYPREEAAAICEKLGYEDQLLDTAEPFGLWVIESKKDISKALPLPDCGLPVIFTDNQKPYKQRKVRILNGAHTSFVPMAFLCGHDDVLSAMRDPAIARFMQDTIHGEVIPTLTLPKDDLLAFANAVSERFGNPYIKHLLLSICLNSVSKWRARCLPSLEGYVAANGKLPEHLAFSLAALMALYHGGTLKPDGTLECRRNGKPYTLQDEARVLRFFAEHADTPAPELTHLFLSDQANFGRDLTAIPGLEAYVAEALEDILTNGAQAARDHRFA